ncbi:2830_t:CDS:2 [Entrophospora sp. SA101]|nr:2830_t:CDS:2 [Entrophospora sp. SA101]
MAIFLRPIPNSGGLRSRLGKIKIYLTELRENDLTTQGNPNLSALNVSLPKRLEEIAEFHFERINESNKEIKKLEEKIRKLESNKG